MLLSWIFVPLQSIMATILYLVRHGETYDNEKQLMQGQIQGELNATGIKQAEQVRDKFAHEHFDAFVSSDLKRSIDTCRIIAEPHNMEVVQTPLLRERDWGSFTGCYIPDLKGKPWPDDIEPLDVLRTRARDFLHYLRDTYPNQKVLAVGHGIVNKAIQAEFYNKQMNEVTRMNNADIRIMVLE